MSVWYIDTSAALKLLTTEDETQALIRVLRDQAPTLVSSVLLETELRRAVERVPGLIQVQVTDVLTRVNIYEIEPSWFTAAGLLPGGDLRSLDALHVACAIRLRADRILTYDRRMQQASWAVGIPSEAPR